MAASADDSTTPGSPAVPEAWARDFGNGGYSLLYDVSKSYEGRLARRMMRDGVVAALFNRQGRAKLRTNIEQFLYNCLACRAGQRLLDARADGERLWIAVPLWEAYQGKSRYRLTHVSYDYLKKVLTLAEREGWIKILPGDFVNEKVTRFRPVEGFAGMVDGYLTDLAGQVRFHPPVEGIVLKDCEKRLVQYQDDETTCTLRAELEDYNGRIDSLNIGLFVNYSNTSIHQSSSILPLRIGTEIDTSTSWFLKDLEMEERWDGVLYSIPSALARAVRIFNRGSWKHSGRYYAPYQNLPRIIRSGLMLDGEKTAELDYSGLHLRMLYNYRGMGLEGDPYEIPGLPRKAVKRTLLVMLNAGTYQSMYKLLNGEVEAGKLDTKGIPVREIVRELKEKHDPVKSYFNSDAGVLLQRWDSELASRILKKITALVIHDSYIVRHSQTAELRTIMEEAYRDVFGFSIPIDPSS